jgi:hypothetical protein
MPVNATSEQIIGRGLSVTMVTENPPENDFGFSKKLVKATSILAK